MNRSVTRRWTEARLPKGYARLGTRYGGWWVDINKVDEFGLVIDCGLGEDVSFLSAFCQLFPSVQAIGVEASPQSLAWCQKFAPKNVEIVQRALWVNSDETMAFHLPREKSLLPQGADGVSGSRNELHGYVVGGKN